MTAADERWVAAAKVACQTFHEAMETRTVHPTYWDLLRPEAQAAWTRAVEAAVAEAVSQGITGLDA